MIQLNELLHNVNPQNHVRIVFNNHVIYVGRLFRLYKNEVYSEEVRKSKVITIETIYWSTCQRSELVIECDEVKKYAN